MNFKRLGVINRLGWSLPWLTRYPLWRAAERRRRPAGDAAAGGQQKQQHLILTVANHFEPSWSESGGLLNLPAQLSRLDQWCRQARAIGRAVVDHDNTPFRHTNFFPAEQYHRPLLEKMAELQAEGFGEVEVHLHHGVERPDTAANLRRTLTEFRDVLAEEHKCLSRENGVGAPRYGFVHGNWALANSAGGKYCGVDSEMRILAETGCYADFTLPSAPDRSQVPRINAIYECGGPLDKRVPHRSGPSLRVGKTPTLPVLFTGPLVFDWGRRRSRLPIPRLDDGNLIANYPLTLDRFHRWRGAHIGVRGRPEWIFIKLHCHGFFPWDQDTVIGDKMRRFLEEVLEFAEQSSGRFKIHFASAREAFNIAIAATEGRDGNPSHYRDYRLRQIMREEATRATGTAG